MSEEKRRRLDELFDEVLDASLQAREEIAAEKLRQGHRYTQTVRVDRAHLRMAQAERVLLRALDSYTAMPEAHWQVGDVSSLLGAALMAQDRRAEGIRLLREGHATVVAHVGPDSWQARATTERLVAAGG